MLNRIIKYFLENQMITTILLVCIVGWGLMTVPFGWKFEFLPLNPVPVDAIPNIGENQQILYTQWPGRSPQDIEDQITYPLTTSLLGIPGVKSIRSSSIFGVSSIYLIFNDEIEFYWSRSRILEKVNSLSANLLPSDVKPILGPDATALGQIYWYTLEGRDKDGNPTGGWDLHEIRTVQDFYVKYALSTVQGVSEVASVGGHVREYQVDVNPNALKAHGISLQAVMMAVKKSNRDVGAKTIEINQAEYLVRGLGNVNSISDLEEAVVSVNNNVPIRVKDIGNVTIGPATRRGMLDKDGAEVVGGVVVARYGSNPMEVIQNVKDKISEISSGLPKKTLANGVESQLTLVPFYDRTQLIHETLGTLEEALSLEVLITILVVIIMLLNFRASLLISSLLPIAILMVFVFMKFFNVDANIVALSGIAIAIGTMVDLGIVLSENIIKHVKAVPMGQKISDTIYKASAEVSSAILTAVATTLVSFLPVFALEAAEGKLFRPLAFTKTFALIAALLVVFLILPTLTRWFFSIQVHKNFKGKLVNALVIAGGLVMLVLSYYWAGLTLVGLGIAWFMRAYILKDNLITKHLSIVVSACSVIWLLTEHWMPLGAGKSLATNLIFVAILLILILGTFGLLGKYYSKILGWCLAHKRTFLFIPSFVILFGLIVWVGFGRTFGFVSNGFGYVGININKNVVWSGLSHAFPGLGKEFMPTLDEGSFLLMPTSMPHAGVEQNKRVVQQLDMLLANIPEVELAVGKMGRVESALDPAPISMYENIINYKSEYALNEKGYRQRFKVDEDGNFVLKSSEKISNRTALKEGITDKDLVLDPDGNYFRNWRAEIKSSNDIWNEIVRVTKIPGVTSAPKLQPIETRLVMLQTGMRAPIGIKVYGPSLETIDAFGTKLEKIVKEVPSVNPDAVFADRMVGKPYIHLDINRHSISRHGLTVEDLQQTIETAIGGMQVTSTIEGREKFAVRIRYPRELRNDPASLAKILISTPTGAQVPLGELVDIAYARGPQMIKSEDTFLVGYVLLDKKNGYAESDVVEDAQKAIQAKIDTGSLIVPSGVSFKFSGNYENQIRAEKRLSIIIPLVLLIIFLILYFQFKSVSTSLMIFTGVAMAFGGAFLTLWLYEQDWFLNFSLLGASMRDVFQVHTINLSVAVWVGFIALFGLATDDGVLIGTFLDQSMIKHKPKTVDEIRKAVTEAGLRRIRPAIMTSATTVIALLPILTSSGRGADIMIPMAIPAFGGMIVASITFFITPVLYSMREESRLKKSLS